MTSTTSLEEFRDFISIPIENLMQIVHEDLQNFKKRMSQMFDSIISEARHNFSELESSNNNTVLFFQDMVYKIKSTEDLLFERKGQATEYRDTKRDITLNDSYPDQFLNIIYYYIQKIKKRFEIYTEIRTSTIDQNTTQRGKKTPPSFYVIDRSVLNDAFKQLINLKKIESEKKQFVDIFTGTEISAPVKWIGTKEELSYFIKGILKTKNLISIPNKGIWDVTIKCFVNELDQRYTKDQLRGAHKPKEIRYIKDVIDTFDI